MRVRTQITIVTAIAVAIGIVVGFVVTVFVATVFNGTAHAVAVMHYVAGVTVIMAWLALPVLRDLRRRLVRREAAARASNERLSW